MANPQKENGYLGIANELVEAMARLHLSGNEHQLLWAVWRKTWCWNKKTDWIALTQLQKATGLSRVAVCRAKKELVSKKILVQSNGALSFNKNYESWVVSKKTLVSKTATGSVKKVLGGSVKNDTHNNNITKETITTATTSPDIVSVIDAFRGINPTISFGNKTQRGAAEYLVKKFGLEKTLGLVKAAIAIHGKKYAPTITTPYLLKEKLAEMAGYYKRQQDTSSSKVGFIE